MRLSNVNIGTKIGAGFAILVAIVIALGVTALYQLSSVNHVAEYIANNNLVSVRTAAALSDALGEIRRAEARHVMTADAQEMTAQEARISAARQKITELEPVAVKMFSSPVEVQAWTAFQQHRQDWYAVWEKLHTLSRQGGAASLEAQKIYTGESSKAFNAALADLKKLGDINSKLSDEARDNAAQTYSTARMLVIVSIVLAVVIAVAMSWFISHAISIPIGTAVTSARQIAAGDMTVPIHVEGTDETAQLLQALNAMRQGLATVVGTVRKGSESVASASAEIAQGNQDLSARTESQASALEETAASMEELSAQVKQNADNARQANQLAASASSVAERGGDVVGRVVQTMKEINDSSRKIADIISVIDGIAFQTNILALNAAVEAARAGEQGRGFAVVASEVRSLAGRSADAAKEIKTLINASVERVEQGTVLVDEAGTTMTEVVDSIRRVNDLVGEISAASNEQSAGVAQVGEAVTQMDQATQQNAALVEQMAAAASSLKSQSNELVQTVAVFKIQAETGGARQPRPPVRATEPKKLATRPSPQNAARPKAPAQPRPSLATTPKALPKPRPATQAPSSGAEGDWESF